jgi:hypothetical protein
MKLLLCFAVFVVLHLSSLAQVTTFTMDSSKFNKPLMDELEMVYRNDQFSRSKLMDMIRTSGVSSIPDSLRKQIHYQDSLNQIIVVGILDKMGWQGPQDVGMNGSMALFLVIQHADLATQEKYLPMIRQAEKDGKVLSSSLALLEDRVAMRHKQPQIYGSQIFSDTATKKMYVYPVIDPDHLDERRKSMGLQPMADYMPNFNMTWDLEAYKKQLPFIRQMAQHQGM